MATIVLASNGSLGDIFPFIALGKALQAQGHSIVFATMEHYQARVEHHGFLFHPIRPNIPIQDPVLYKKAMDPIHGTSFFYQELVMKNVEVSYEDLLSACSNADMLIGHCIAVVCPVVAEVKKIPWMSVALAPASYWSVYDVSVFDTIGFLKPTRTWGPLWWKIWKQLASWVTSSWSMPLYRLRKKIGLSAGRNPIMQAWHSPNGELAFFSKYFAAPQPDWPPNVSSCGFPLFDNSEEESLSSETLAFLQKYPEPVVVTLGSAATYFAEDFYKKVALALQMLEKPGILIIGKNNPISLPTNLTPLIHITEYEPYSIILAQASVVIHQGGIGTTSQALAAGKPMLIVPFSHDQPDNAARIERLGCGLHLSKKQATIKNIAQKITLLLAQQHIRQTCLDMQKKLQEESCLTTAVQVIETVLSKRA